MSRDSTPWPWDLDPDPRLTDPEAARLFAERARDTRGHLPGRRAGIEVARARVRRSGRGPVSDEVLQVADTTVRGAAGPLPARTYVPRDGSRATVLHLHGGGWALGDLDSDDLLCRRIAAQAGVCVLSLGYRLAPEHPFPAALDDAAAVAGLLADGRVAGLAGPLVVSGLGAGGALAATLARRARDGYAPAIAHHLLFCPVLDSDLDRTSHRTHGEGLGVTVEDLAWFWSMYVPDRGARRHPEVSPLRAEDLSGLSPATVVVAGADPLRDEALDYGERLAAAGGNARTVFVEGVPHAFVAVPGISAGERAVRAAAAHLTATLDARAGVVVLPDHSSRRPRPRSATVLPLRFHERGRR